MSTQSFPLIGIDVSGNQHEFEWPGTTEKDAAMNGAQFRNYVKVLSRDKRNGLKNYRKSLFETEPSNVIFSRPKSPLALLLENPFLKTGPAILEHLRDKGLSVNLVEDPDTGNTSVKLIPMPNCKVKMDDRAALRNFVAPNRQLIIDALRAENSKNARAEASKSAPETPGDTDPLKGKKLRDIVLSILPQMPTPFTKEDFIARLRAAKYNLLAEDDAKIQNAITYCTRAGGETVGVGRGKYAVREEFKHRKTPPKLTVQVPIAELLPEEAAVLVKASEMDVGIDDAQPSVSPESPVAAPEPIIQSPVNPLAALLDLASQAVAGADDTADLVTRFEEATGVFENAMLEAVSAYTAPAKALVERLRSQNAARQALARLLTKGAEDGS